ncbi:7028_t:CDS:2, partial [Funneliformis caledonium]
DNADNFSVYDKLVENDKTVNIVKRLQEAAKKYYQEHIYHKEHRLCYIGNSNCTKRRKNQQQREAAKNINVEIDDSTSEQLDDEIEDYNWHNRILTDFKNLKLDIKKENTNSEI